MMERITQKLKEEHSIIFFTQPPQEFVVTRGDDNINTNNCTNCTIVNENQQQQQQNSTDNINNMPSTKIIGGDEDDKGCIQVTRPISPTVLLALQNKIKCKQCQACLKVKPNGKRKRPWMLICENATCTSPETQLRRFTEAVVQPDAAEETERKRRENILKNCFEENYE